MTCLKIHDSKHQQRAEVVGGVDGELPHLVAYHDVGDLGLAVHVVVFLLVGENREDEVARFTLALPYQEATGFAFVCEQFLCISPREVPVVPPGPE